MATFRRPVDVVDRLVRERTEREEVALALVVAVEGDDRLGQLAIDNVGVVRGDEAEALARRFPRECDDGVLDLDDLDGDVLFPETEQLEVAVLGFARLGVAVDLDTEEVAVRLEVELALRIV